MATLGLVEYQNASPEVRAVYDDIMATRQTDYINNFWKALAHDRNDYLTWLHLALASRGSARTAAAREALRLNPLSPEINSLRPYLGLPALSRTKPATTTTQP